MIDTTRLRELLADATPAGDWTAVEGDLQGGTLEDYIAKLLANRRGDGTSTGRLWLTLAPNPIDPERGAWVCPAMAGDGPQSEANARLTAAAVNALPELLDVIDRLRSQLEDANVTIRAWAGVPEPLATRVVTHTDRLLAEHPEWRRGQALFQALYDLDQDIADRLRGGPMDPFHRDDRETAFLEAIALEVTR